MAFWSTDYDDLGHYENPEGDCVHLVKRHRVRFWVDLGWDDVSTVTSGPCKTTQGVDLVGLPQDYRLVATHFAREALAGRVKP